MKTLAAFCVALAMAVSQGWASGAEEPVAPTTRPTTRLTSPLPIVVGHHRIRYFTTMEGENLRMAVVVSNSKLIAKTPGRVPALIFLCGSGERGSDGMGVFYNGPAGEMQRHANLNESLPMMVISPQCPDDRRWDDPGMDQALLRLVQLIAADPRIDPDRIYLTGLSMGGKGAWELAAVGAKYFAAIAVTAAPEVTPRTTVPAVKGLPIWIVVGRDDDSEFTQGSIAMDRALRKAGADVAMSVLPGVEHNSWASVYPKMEFYQWLAAHTRGKEPAKKYTEDELYKIAMTPVVDPVTEKVVHDFGVFAPYWQIINCGTDNYPGLYPDTHGRKNVMVISPLSEHVPCRMQTTWKIPEGKHARLSLIAGCDAHSEWKLTVRVGDEEVLSTPIDSSTTQDNWLTKDFDLSAWAGKDVHIDVYVSARGDNPSTAYFAKLAVEVQ